MKQLRLKRYIKGEYNNNDDDDDDNNNNNNNNNKTITNLFKKSSFY